MITIKRRFFPIIQPIVLIFISSYDILEGMKRTGFIELTIVFYILLLSAGTIVSYTVVTNQEQTNKKTKSAEKSKSAEKQVKLDVVTSLQPTTPLQTLTSTPTLTPTPIKSRLTPTKKPTPTTFFYPTRTPTPTPVFSVKLNSVFPSSGNIESEITLRGSGFGSTTKNVWFYTTSGINVGGGPILMWNDTEIRTKVPPLKGNTDFKIEVEIAKGEKSNRVYFRVTGGQPYVTAITPSNGKPGGEITISGEGFGNGSGIVYFYTPGNYSVATGSTTGTAWGDTQIKLTLPGNLSAGQEYGVQIKTSDGRRNSIKFYQLGN